MKTLKTNLVKLRKKYDMTQRDLADKLGLTYQTISKWENGNSLPDISLLPSLADIFHVSTDQLLGISPLAEDRYHDRNKDSSDYRDKILSQFEATRRLYWNEDYLEFIVKKVWKIDSPVHIAEIASGNGLFSKQILKYLPEGSTYTGFEKSQLLLEDGIKRLRNKNITLLSFEEAYDIRDKYDIVICQSYLRNHASPDKGVELMIKLAKPGGLIVAHEYNKPFENFGLLLGHEDDNSFEKSTFLHKLWLKELEKEGRDYRVGLKLPLMFKQAGLRNIGSRMNDHIDILLGDDASKNKLELLNEYYRLTSISEENFLDFLIERGLSRYEALRYIELYNHRKEFMNQASEHVEMVHISGLILTWGKKESL
ncbi:DNA (cytosine-5-)-methyltransferase [Acidaminobacter sp. JC074]|uniref:DNA (cytosine-5-)-methyltransferase n=1 Tax=Acidaminobacter sp. JC074 TaxID=2530199 RepID=UPI001F0FDCA6|nr:DNA (cytosine-5-)-methyltransferase [Acidaminobacter sp. JC074]